MNSPQSGRLWRVAPGKISMQRMEHTPRCRPSWGIGESYARGRRSDESILHKKREHAAIGEDQSGGDGTILQPVTYLRPRSCLSRHLHFFSPSCCCSKHSTSAGSQAIPMFEQTG